MLTSTSSTLNFAVVAGAGRHRTTEAELHLHSFFVAASLALPSNLGGSDAGLAGRCDDAWDKNELTHQVALEVTKHFWVFVTRDLHLELWHVVDARNLVNAGCASVVV